MNTRFLSRCQACVRTGLLILPLLLAGCAVPSTNSVPTGEVESVSLVQLPGPQQSSGTSIEQALQTRRSVREFSTEGVSLDKIAQLLWAAQGVTAERSYRTAPSAGALYPLEIYLVTGEVSGLDQGVYRYVPGEHALVLVVSGDLRAEVQAAALHQESIGNAPALIVIAAQYDRTTGKYGQRGIRYVHIETGCAAQNIYLQTVPLGLGTVLLGAFHDQDVAEILGMPLDHQPLAIMPVGVR
jgi:SagB-type dehydrogenase family enzyme